MTNATGLSRPIVCLEERGRHLERRDLERFVTASP
jgi:hypothetical protein